MVKFAEGFGYLPDRRKANERKSLLYMVAGGLVPALVAIGIAAFFVSQGEGSNDGGFVAPTLTPTPFGTPPRSRATPPPTSISGTATAATAGP